MVKQNTNIESDNSSKFKDKVISSKNKINFVFDKKLFVLLGLLVAIVLIFSLIAFFSNFNQNVLYTVHVMDKRGDLIESALVSFISGNDIQKWITDSNGDAKFILNPNIDYNIMIEKEGYISVENEFYLGADNTIDVYLIEEN